MLNLIRDINPTQAYINEYVHLDNGMVVNRYSLCMSTLVDYEVWEPLTHYPTAPYSSHSTQTTIDGKQYGSLTTRALPPELDALPGWTPGFWPEERIAAVHAWQAENEREAEAIIKATFPQDFVEQEEVAA